MLLAVALAAPYLLVGALSDGPFASRVLQGGFVLLVPVALIALWMWRQGPRIDREQDERERLVLHRSAAFTCFVTAVALQAYWAWRFAVQGNAGDDVFWVLVVFWGAFAGSYLYNKIRLR
jgi:4-hydroxybenzoate polyprenyltransferase